MYKSILAISEGGPDAAMSFGLAARLAASFDAVVDAVHFTEVPDEETDIASQAMPFLRPLTEQRLRSRREEFGTRLPRARSTGQGRDLHGRYRA